MKVSLLLSNHVTDARLAMAALIEARAVIGSEQDPEFPAKVAALAWAVADCMDLERAKRARGEVP